MLNDALASSHFAIAGKLTGNDAIVVRGACDAPSVLLVDGDGARLVAAGDAVGPARRPTPRTRLRERLGPAWRVAAIGPAGERLVRYATVSHDGRHAGRGGLGAVLGAKQLKAVAVRAATQVAPADPPARAGRGEGPARALVRARDREVPRARHAGQPARVQRASPRCPPATSRPPRSRRHRRSPPRTWPSRGVARDSCASCTIGCEHIYCGAKAARTTRVEYENVVRARPAVRGVRPRRGAARPARRCDELGLDTISAGGTIAWAMECAERGCSTRRGCASATATALLRALDEIGAREGLGDLLAEGSRRAAAEVVGQGSEASPCTSRGWSCPATSRARCTRWRSAWRSTPAAPTTTAPAPTRPTCPGDLDRLDGGAAARRRGDRDRGPRRGDGLADPVQVPARRVHRAVRGVGRAARAGHRLGHRRPTSCTTPPAHRRWPSAPSTCARAGRAPRTRLPERLLDEPARRSPPAARRRSRRERLRRDGRRLLRGTRTGPEGSAASPTSPAGWGRSCGMALSRPAVRPTAAAPSRCTIDGARLTVPRARRSGTAAKDAGIDIPVLCHDERYDPVGVCRMCVVDVGGRVLRGGLRAAVRGRHGGHDRDAGGRAAAARMLTELLMADQPPPTRTRRRPRPATTSCSRWRAATASAARRAAAAGARPRRSTTPTR